MTEQRRVARIDHPQVQSGMHSRHRVRHLLQIGDWEATDPFLALAEDWFPSGTFGPHPHRGIETVTYVIEGSIEHRDSGGHKGTIGVGDAQWMTAGRGLLHSETPPEGMLTHSLQLWVNLPAAEKFTEPRYQDLVGQAMPIRREPGAEVVVYSGTSATIVSTTKNHVPVTMLKLCLLAGARVQQGLPGDYNAFVVVLDGAGYIGADRTPVRQGEVAWLTFNDSSLMTETTFAAVGGERLEALLFAGRPLREPVRARGPFVMNTEAQIEQAFADYRAGRFGQLS
jgi:quercetin 2,3-dioxygenase